MNKLELKKRVFISVLLSLLVPSKVCANNLVDSYYDYIFRYYYSDQKDYYNDNPDMLEKDSSINDEIVIYSDDSINENEFIERNIRDTKINVGDIVLFNGMGNATSYGNLNNTKIYNYEEPGVIVGIKDNSDYKYAIADYNFATKETKDVIGWFKKENILCYVDIYSDTIKRPIIKKIVSSNIINDKYELPYGYKKLTDDNSYGIYIGYSNKEKDDYYIHDNRYVSKDEKLKKVNIDKKLIKKYHINSK